MKYPAKQLYAVSTLFGIEARAIVFNVRKLIDIGFMRGLNFHSSVF